MASTPPKAKKQPPNSSTQRKASSKYGNVMESISKAIVNSKSCFGGDDPLLLSTACFLLNMMSDESCINSRVTEKLKLLQMERLLLDHLPTDAFSYAYFSDAGPKKDSLSIIQHKAFHYHNQVKYLEGKLKKLNLNEEENKEWEVLKGKMAFDHITTGRKTSMAEAAETVTKLDALVQQNIEELKCEEKRRQTKEQFSNALLSAIYKVLAEHAQQDIEMLNAEEGTLCSKTKAKLENRISDIKSALGDFFVAGHSSILDDSGDSPASFATKLPIIREFVDAVRDKSFNELTLCRRMDTTLKMNVKLLEELIPLMNFYHKKGDKNSTDLVSNGGHRGGDPKEHMNMLCSKVALSKQKRKLEGLATDLFGAQITKDNIAAQIDIEKFLDLYVEEFCKSLDQETDFDEEGNCKYYIFVDLTNDGTVWSNLSLNIAGLKIYPVKIEGRTVQPLNGDRTVCIPLSVFVDKDNKDNLDEYHAALYRKIQRRMKKVMNVQVGDKERKFRIKFAYSGDLKSHALSCGLRSLTGTSVATFMHCCSDVHKETLCLVESRKCVWCTKFKRKACRHRAYCRYKWKVPKPDETFQPIIDCFKNAVGGGNDTSAPSSSSGKRKFNEENIKQPCPFHCIDRDLKQKDNKDYVRKQLHRMSEFSQSFTNDKTALAFMKEYDKNNRRISLQELGANSNHESTVAVSLENAKIEEMQHQLRIRYCTSQEDCKIFQTDFKGMNELVINSLESCCRPYKVEQSVKTSGDIVHQTRELLQITLKCEEYILHFYAEDEKTTTALILDKMKLIICDLHMEMRIGLNLLEKLINQCIQNRYTSTAANNLRAELEYWINTEVFRTKGTGTGTYHFPVKDEQCQQISLRNTDLVKILEKIDEFIDRIISFDQKAALEFTHNNTAYLRGQDDGNKFMEVLTNYRVVFNGFKVLMKQLRAFKDSNVDEDYIRWQLDVVDPWIEHYLKLFGWQGVGYYVHYLMRGHVCEQLMYCKNIHRHSQQNWEGLVGVIKKYLASHTQHGGNSSGGKNSGQQEPINVALLRYMLRLALFAVFPDDKRIKELLEEKADVLTDDKLGVKGATYVDAINDMVVDENHPFEAVQDATKIDLIDGDEMNNGNKDDGNVEQDSN